jgi:pimeloyl-ACP methyl ester carboxylesterase
VVLGITLPFALTAAHDRNADEAIAAIHYALGDAAPNALRGHVDGQRIAALGHSFGGKIAFYAAARDPRIDLVVGWDPSNAGGPPCFIDAMACNQFPVAPNCLVESSGVVHQLHAETLVLRVAPDGANPEPAHNALHFYRGAPSPATLIDFDDNVAHGDFANPVAPVHRQTRRVHLAFLLSRLRGTTGLEDYLPGGTKIGQDQLVARVLVR